MIRVAVFDDSKDRRDSLETFLELSNEYLCVGLFDSCLNIISKIESCLPQIVLMDIEMPEVNGLEGIKMIKNKFPLSKIIVQTAFDDDEKVFTAMQLGAEGYILKSAGVSQLDQAIQEVYKGGAMMSPSIAYKIMRFFNQRTTQQDHGLSYKESEVLDCLSKGQSYKMIALDMDISYHTVNNHIKSIYRKLQVHSVGEALSLGHKKGWF